MNSIKTALAVAVIGTSVLTLESCKKYDDGPLISLRSKTARLTGDWKLVGGNAYTDSVEYIIQFQKDEQLVVTISYGAYSYFSFSGYNYTYRYTGDWEWASSKNNVKVAISSLGNYGTASDSLDNWEITRLTNDEFNCSGNNGMDFKFRKK